MQYSTTDSNIQALVRSCWSVNLGKSGSEEWYRRIVLQVGWMPQVCAPDLPEGYSCLSAV